MPPRKPRPTPPADAPGFANKAFRDAIRMDLAAALHPIATKHGVKLVIGYTTYEATTMTIKVEAGVIENGIALTIEAREFQVNADLYGFQPTDLGRTFTHTGTTYRIIGLNPAKRSKPVLCEDPTGKRYLFGPDIVHQLLA
jgi:hypothetical protein